MKRSSCLKTKSYSAIKLWNHTYGYRYKWESKNDSAPMCATYKRIIEETMTNFQTSCCAKNCENQFCCPVGPNLISFENFTLLEDRSIFVYIYVLYITRKFSSSFNLYFRVKFHIWKNICTLVLVSIKTKFH